MTKKEMKELLESLVETLSLLAPGLVFDISVDVAEDEDEPKSKKKGKKVQDEDEEDDEDSDDDADESDEDDEDDEDEGDDDGEESDEEDEDDEPKSKKKKAGKKKVKNDARAEELRSELRVLLAKIFKVKPDGKKLSYGVLKHFDTTNVEELTPSELPAAVTRATKIIQELKKGSKKKSKK